MTKTFTERLLNVIPGGAHTYSRGYDQFPANAPELLERGQGAYTFDIDGNRFLDFGMALRSVGIGYAEASINQAACKYIGYGNNLTRPSHIELEAAERLVHEVPSVDMVKFTKNGSTAVSGAVKLARAATGRELIARCVDHPFFSFDDWFIGSTNIQKGVPKNIVEQTKLFSYNKIETLQSLFDEQREQISCVVLEASTLAHPGPSIEVQGETFLHDVQRLCKKHGAVFILDEMITGFRWSLQGAQGYYGVTPDLCTFGKAMANGFSVAAVAGKRELMQLGSIETVGQERTFLLSTTHGAEMSGLGAFVATMDFMHANQVIEHYWQFGKSLISLLNETAADSGLSSVFKADGVACSPYYLFNDSKMAGSAELRTLFMQEMIKQGVLIPWIALCYRMGEEELAQTKRAAHHAFEVVAKAVEQGVDGLLVGPAAKPVFRQFN